MSEIKALNIYDIQDVIVKYLDLQSMLNLLRSSKLINDYTYSSRYRYILSNKICKYYNCLTQIKLIKLIDIKNMSKVSDILYKFYTLYNNPSIKLSSFLCYLDGNDEYSFELFANIISFNYFKVEDLRNLVMCSNYRKILYIKKNILIPIEILEDVIYFKIKKKEIKEAEILIEYMFFKYFWRHSEYIQSKITLLIIECIKYDNYRILRYVYIKRKHYRFTVNYQSIISFIITQKSIKYIDLIDKYRIEQNIELKSRNQVEHKITIQPKHINYLMYNQHFDVLSKIINLYIAESINLDFYIEHIKMYYNKTCQNTFEKEKVILNFNDENINILNNILNKNEIKTKLNINK